MDKIVIQQELCDGCLDCVNACEKLYESPRISVHEFDNQFYPIVCQQCEDAPCITICPVDAIEDEGVNKNKCIACGLCVMVCPFGAISVKNKVANKCNQCLTSEDKFPACIKACSKRAISKIDTEVLMKEKQEKHIALLTGMDKKKQGINILDIITSNTKANEIELRDE